MAKKLNLDDFEWTLLEKKELAGVPVSVYHSKIPGRRHWTGVGIDPGRNFGICTLDGREAWAIAGTLLKEDKQWKYGITAYEFMSNPRNYYGQGPAVIEGPAYKMPKGQADLGHTRMGFTLGLYYAGFSVDIVPPATIRSQALGNGKLSGLEVWPSLQHNAADAVAAALYAAGLRRDMVEREE